MKRTLFICNSPWEVNTGEKRIEDDGRGSIDSVSHVMLIAKGGCREVLRSTLGHETLHTFLATTVNRHPSDEEECICAMEIGLASLMIDPRNKWWIDVMTGKTRLK